VFAEKIASASPHGPHCVRNVQNDRLLDVRELRFIEPELHSRYVVRQIGRLPYQMGEVTREVYGVLPGPAPDLQYERGLAKRFL